MTATIEQKSSHCNNMEEKIRLTIGARLREERERLGMSQAAFAEIGDVAMRTEQDWERGVSAPKGDFLAIAATRGVDVLYVLTGERQELRDSLTDTLEQMSRYLDAVPVKQRSAIAGVVAGFARTPNDAALLSALHALLENRPVRSRKLASSGVAPAQTAAPTYEKNN